MKKLFIVLFAFASNNLWGQELFLQIEQHHGISGFSRNTLPYMIKYSYEYGLSTGVSFSPAIEFKIGAYYQSAGAGSNWYFSENEQMDYGKPVRQNYNLEYLKLPADIVVILGKKAKFFLGVGLYYSFHLNSTFETDSPDGNVSAISPSYEEMSNNDFGIRVSPSVLIPLSEKVKINLGVLQEFGIYQYFTSTRLYTTYLTGGIRYSF
jgi:hypothetical protein